MNKSLFLLLTIGDKDDRIKLLYRRKKMKVVLPLDENVPYAVIDLRDCKNRKVFYDESLVDVYNDPRLSEQEKKEALNSLYSTRGLDFFSKYVFAVPKRELTPGIIS